MKLQRMILAASTVALQCAVLVNCSGDENNAGTPNVGSPADASADGTSVADDASASADGASIDSSDAETTNDASDGAVVSCKGLALPQGSYFTVPSLDGTTLPQGNMCIEAWVRLDGSAAAGDAVIASSYTLGNSGAFILRCSVTATSSNLAFSSETPGAVLSATGIDVGCADNQWHHVAACRSITGVNVHYDLFFDGVLVGSGSGANVIGAYAEFYVGGVSYAEGAAQPGLGGAIAELRISNSVRYSSAFTPSARFTPDTNTVALYHLDETSGTTVHDSTSYAYTGTTSGSPTWLNGNDAGAAFCSP